MYTFYHESSADDNNTAEAGAGRVTLLSVTRLDEVWVYDDKCWMPKEICDVKEDYISHFALLLHIDHSVAVSHTISAISCMIRQKYAMPIYRRLTFYCMSH